MMTPFFFNSLFCLLFESSGLIILSSLLFLTILPSLEFFFSDTWWLNLRVLPGYYFNFLRSSLFAVDWLRIITFYVSRKDYYFCCSSLFCFKKMKSSLSIEDALLSEPWKVTLLSLGSIKLLCCFLLLLSSSSWIKTSCFILSIFNCLIILFS